MAKLSLPIPSPVPLDVLRQSVGALAAAPLTGSRWWSRNTSSRLASRCGEYYIDPVWMLALHTRSAFLRNKNFGRRTEGLAGEILAHIGCTFGMFPELFAALEDVGKNTRRDDGVRRDFFEALIVLAGIGDWTKRPAIITALAEHGLRPGMPLEKLFAYDSQEPKKLTVAEELLAFGAMSAWSVLPASDTDLDLNPDRTIIELWAELAVWPEPASPIIVQRRNELIAAARRHLSPEALMRIGYVEE